MRVRFVKVSNAPLPPLSFPMLIKDKRTWRIMTTSIARNEKEGEGEGEGVGRVVRPLSLPTLPT